MREQKALDGQPNPESDFANRNTDPCICQGVPAKLQGTTAECKALGSATKLSWLHASNHGLMLSCKVHVSKSLTLTLSISGVPSNTCKLKSVVNVKSLCALWRSCACIVATGCACRAQDRTVGCLFQQNIKMFCTSMVSL